MNLYFSQKFSSPDKIKSAALHHCYSFSVYVSSPSRHIPMMNKFNQARNTDSRKRNWCALYCNFPIHNVVSLNGAYSFFLLSGNHHCYAPQGKMRARSFPFCFRSSHLLLLSISFDTCSVPFPSPPRERRKRRRRRGRKIQLRLHQLLSAIKDTL